MAQLVVTEQKGPPICPSPFLYPSVHAYLHYHVEKVGKKKRNTKRETRRCLSRQNDRGDARSHQDGWKEDVNDGRSVHKVNFTDIEHSLDVGVAEGVPDPTPSEIILHV